MTNLEFEEATNQILDDLEALEHFLKSDYITLKEYYEIKSQILLKYVALGEEERSNSQQVVLNNDV